jgi:serine/threonine protein kinase
VGKPKQHRIDSPRETSFPEEERIQALLEEILETDARPEQVSGGDQVLEHVLRERLHRAREVQSQIDALFPTQSDGGDPTRCVLLDRLRKDDDQLPEIPGYEVQSVIGTGGMGVVYRSRHLKLNRLVAIKMVINGAYARRDALECLLREAQNVAALHHPNIVQVYDVAEHDGFPYYAMELLEGGDLAQKLQGKPRPAREAAELTRVLAGAVHAAHLSGIVHRDLKPGNILLTPDEIPKIGDFSLARRFQPDSAILSAARPCGTPSYMAPEQAAGNSNALQPAVDIYSLGAVLYELLTGRPPFSAETSAETLKQVMTEEPVPPSRLNSRVPRDLQTICLKCLQKDPARRYESAAHLADDLRRFTRGEPIQARPSGVTERAIKWCRRRPAAALAIVVSTVALTGAIAGGIWLDRIERARHTEGLVRRESARTSIESALPVLSQLVKRREWSDATGVLRSAQGRSGEAQSPELEVRLAKATEELEVAQELDRIRQSFPEPDEAGYTYLPARDAYARVFNRVGIGSDIELETAALRVRESPLREELLIALDHAAFTERFNTDGSELERLLAIGRTAAPSPWQDRFRDPVTWRDRANLTRLANDASKAEPPSPSHQMVIVGFLLSSLGDNHTAIEILREAHLRDPSDFWVNLELGHVLTRQKRNAEALQYFRAAVALKPTHYVAWTWLGHAQLSNGNAEAAIVSLRKAISLRPEYPTSWQNLIGTLAASEQWDEALATERDAVAAIPTIAMPAGTVAVLHLCRARSAVSKGEWQIAAESYEQTLEGDYATNSHAWFEFAAVRVLAGDNSGYRKVCASMLERCESAGLRRFLVARACTLAIVSDQQLTRAAELGKPELDLHADSYWSLTEQGALLCRQGKHLEAIPVLKRSLGSSSRPEECIITWIWLSRAHMGLREFDTARMWFNKTATYLDQSAGRPEALHIHDWLEAQILCREVQTILAQ